MNYKLLLPLILLSMSFSISAEERWFEVELLLFQRNVDINTVKEELILKDLNIDTTDSTPLLRAQQKNLCAAATPPCQTSRLASLPLFVEQTQFATAANGFQYLDNTQLQLLEQHEKLKQHAAFTPVLHLAWRMPVKSRNSAKPIHLAAGENFAGVRTQESPDKWAIDGNFKIYLDRYLFIDSQLIIRQKSYQDLPLEANNLNEPAFEIVNSENDVQIIKENENLLTPGVKQKTIVNEALFDQNRRLRSGEIHYFDHPLMGMIVQIRKIAVQESNQ